MDSPNPEPPAAFEPPPSPPPHKLHWPVFLVALLLPPVLTILAVMSKRPGDAPAFIAMGGQPGRRAGLRLVTGSARDTNHDGPGAGNARIHSLVWRGVFQPLLRRLFCGGICERTNMNGGSPEPPVAFEPPQTPAPKLHWPVFLVALLLPPILTLATAQAGWKDFPVWFPFFGGGLAGLICGILLGRRLGKTTTAVVLLSILFLIVFAALSFALCFGGCLLGDFQLNFH